MVDDRYSVMAEDNPYGFAVGQSRRFATFVFIFNNTDFSSV